ncbi:UBP-type zinc finger domain-containing protein [Agromyces sp. Marseille-P2726]|uniref:UBP-type zinc finger domain-containing protein n=1 Tax=Agromyces sp. Marseille-P2726 TaxID=2709132 RepID=UPI00156EC0CB|nr:UBP-type zinc finger domain-containing protein [Agromyces sp. Marseille-P2726]
MNGEATAINPEVPPSGDGCVECLAESTWWWHLRRCAQCGHVGCCDSSPQQHASKHARELGHPIARSFEPGERWFWNYATGEFLRGPQLMPPDSRPVEQGAPAPKALVPPDWRSQLHSPPPDETAEGD